MMNNYKKILMEKKKLLQVSEQSTDTKERKYLNYFNPNKYVKTNSNFFVRVLPRKNDLFFLQFQKHSFKVGATWKNAFCFYSRGADGEIIGKECPFCDFIEENKAELNPDTVYKLKARNSHMLLVYNYDADEVQKYEVNDYGITDILAALQTCLENEEDEFDVDIEGFDLYFKKGNSGYAEVWKAEKPSVILKDIMKNSKNFHEIPNLEAEVIPPFNDTVLKSIRSTFELAVSIFEPTFAKKSKKEESDEDEFGDAILPKEKFDPNEEDFDVEDEVIETDDDDEDVEDIRNFLKNRKK